MLRYYMTAETRAALIAESNRLIAARAAKVSGGSGDVAPTDFGTGSSWTGWGAMPYVTRGPAAPPSYQGLMRFLSPRR